MQQIVSLPDHLESYRNSLKNDSLEDCVAYSQQLKTGDPNLKETAYHYIKYALDAAKYFSTNEDHKSYLAWLTKHQELMTKLFERMVDEVLWHQEADAPVPEDLILTMIREKGFKWFKFCKSAVTWKMTSLEDSTPMSVTLVPRYVDKFKNIWGEQGVAVFDADEMALLLRLKDKEVAKRVYEEKLKRSGVKFFGVSLVDKSSAVDIFRDVDSINRIAVWDWSVKL